MGNMGNMNPLFRPPSPNASRRYQSMLDLNNSRQQRYEQMIAPEIAHTQQIDVADELLDDVPVTIAAYVERETAQVKAFIKRLLDSIPMQMKLELDLIIRDQLNGIIKGDLSISAILERRACIGLPIGYPQHFFAANEYDGAERIIYSLHGGIAVIKNGHPLNSISYVFKHYGSLIIICPTSAVLEEVLRISACPESERNYRPPGTPSWSLITRRYQPEIYRQVVSITTQDQSVRFNGMRSIAPQIFRGCNYGNWIRYGIRSSFNQTQRHARIIAEYYVRNDVDLIIQSIGNLIPPQVFLNGEFYLVRRASQRFDDGNDVFRIPLDEIVIERMKTELKLKYNPNRGVVIKEHHEQMMRSRRNNQM